MRIYNRLPLLAAVLLLLPSCDRQALQGGVGDLPMHLAPSLAGDTRGSLTTALLTDFFLQVTTPGDAAHCYFEHASKDGSGAWKTFSTLLWKDETTVETFCAARFGAYAFTAADFQGDVAFMLPDDQSTQERLNAADLLTMAATGVKYEDTTDGILPVTLAHGLAKVTFTLSFGSGFYDNVFTRRKNPVKNLVVKGANRGFHFNPQDGSVTVQEGTQADITPLEGTFTPATALAQTATASYEAILVPQTFAAGELKVTFRVGVNDYEWSNAAALTLSAGQNYAQAVAVTRAPMPAHAFVDMGEGLLWATCNLGAENPWDYGDYFAWGETTPKDIYSWGTYTFNPSGDGSTFTKYLYGEMLVADDDAATANWDSWRMPTAAEWSSLLDDNKYTWVWTTDYDGSGIDGMLVTSKIAGYIGNCIFLPAAGCLENDSAWNVGTDGFYLSSSLTGFISSRALVMSFSALSIDVLDDDRYYGESVRPVCDK